MLDFYRRVWRAFLAAFVGSLGIVFFLVKDYSLGSIFMFILASVFLILTIIGIRYDYKDSRQKEKEQKSDEDRKALRESVKRLNPEYTEEQIDWWIDGK